MPLVPDMWNKESGYIDINKLRHDLGDGVIADRGKLGALKLLCQRIVRICFASWGSPGKHPLAYSRSCMHSHADCAHRPRQHRTSTQPAISFSVHGVGRSSLPLIPYEDCFFVHTMRANYGNWHLEMQSPTTSASPDKRGWGRNNDGQLTVQWLPRQ